LPVGLGDHAKDAGHLGQGVYAGALFRGTLDAVLAQRGA